MLREVDGRCNPGRERAGVFRMKSIVRRREALSAAFVLKFDIWNLPGFACVRIEMLGDVTKVSYRPEADLPVLAMKQCEVLFDDLST